MLSGDCLGLPSFSVPSAIRVFYFVSFDWRLRAGGGGGTGVDPTRTGPTVVPEGVSGVAIPPGQDGLAGTDDLQSSRVLLGEVPT